jgi:hypothetical protein
MLSPDQTRSLLEAILGLLRSATELLKAKAANERMRQ